MGDARYVILVRHGRRAVYWDRPESGHPLHGWDASSATPARTASSFSGSGYEKAHAMAGRLADELENMSRREKIELRVEGIDHSRHLVAEQTAMVFATVLEKRGLLTGGLEPRDELTPEHPDADDPAAPWARAERPADVRVVIGHQPGLTNIARRLLDDRLLLDGLPIGSAEVACLRVDHEPRLLWCLTEKPDALLLDLKDKIKSKYDVAKFFLGALVVNLGLLLNEKLWQSELLTHKIMTAIATLASLAALGLTAATLFAYDRLLMPREFWSERRVDETGVGDTRARKTREGKTRAPTWVTERPPSQEHLTVFYEMVHIWNAFFIPAVSLALGAVAIFAVVQAHRYTTPLLWHLDEPARWRAGAALMAAIVLLTALALGVPLAWYRARRPRLGTND